MRCFELLDAAAGGPVPLGRLGELVRQALEAQSSSYQYAKVTFDLLLAEYLAHLERQQRTPKYLAAVGYCRRRLGWWWAAKLLSEVTPEMVEMSLEGMPPGNRNHYQDILRAAFNFGVKRGWVLTNPVVRLDRAVYDKPKIHALPNEVVARMFAYAATHQLALLPAWTIGFFCGVREAELDKLLWADVRLEEPEPDVMIRAEVSKTRKKRFIPLPANALEWLAYYFARKGGKPAPEGRVMAGWTRNRLATARARNYAQAVGDPEARWPLNAKRRTFATNWVEAHDNPGRLALLLGHTNMEVSFRHYVGGTTHALGRAYFEIRPNSPASG